MAAADFSDIRGMKAFDPTGNSGVVSVRWKAWIEEFEAFADSKGLFISPDSGDNKAQRRALLLYTAGAQVRETFRTLPNSGTAKEYKKAVDALKAHYVTKTNCTFQRHVFRKTVQGDETISQYVTRLRQISDGCEYRDLDSQIRDQVVECCKSDKLRRKLLEKGDALTLQETLNIATSFETVETQFRAMKLNGQSEQTVNKVTHKPQQQQRHKTDNRKSGECYRCGSSDHFGRDPLCPARGVTCGKCGGRDHYAKKCRSKPSARKFDTGKGRSRDVKHRKPRQVNHVEEDKPDSDSDSSGYAFRMTENKNRNKHCEIPVKLGGVNVCMIVDSGSDCNIIDRPMWEELKQNKIRCSSRKCVKKLYPYASEKPLETIGSFDADLEAGENKIRAEFVVIDGKGEPLLSRSTAQKLGVLKIGLDINSVRSKTCRSDLTKEFKLLFTGIGKLKNRQIKLCVDPNVKPVAQPVRRTPFGIRERVEKKIQELIDKDIIEPVEEPTQWVSPVVVVPKSEGDIRLCVDMRRVNEAIVRERHPIPTIDEVLQDMRESRVFSKLDLKWGYHQLELHPDSRNVTTFVTHCGLYRYKRLLFGINAASEIYQHEIQKILQGVAGQANLSDDIIVHGRDDDEHDKRLRQVFQRLESAGLTLNPDKCEIGMSELTFLGHKLTDKGINPAKEKVEAVRNACEPSNASEVRSFLGLVNYCSRFIPNHATLADPLRLLTRKNQPFVFGPEQKKAFEALKQSLASNQTLGYYDVKAKTKIIADASPVGLGAVLIQEQPDGPRVISYASRSLSDVERRYSQTEKEALALVWACEKFHPYVYGIQFDLVTDHKPLEVIYSPKSKPCARIERWVLRLQPYTFKVVHTPGKQNIADPLSRLINRNTPRVSNLGDITEGHVRFVAVNATPKAMTTREVERESAVDPEMVTLRDCIETGRWDNCPNKLYVALSHELCTIGKVVLRGSRLVIPRKLRPRVLTLAHEGHLGVVGTKQNLRSKVWWPGLEKDAEKHCKTCHGCQLVGRSNPPEPVRSTPIPTGPWEDVALDFLGPLPSGESVLVVIDYYSRYYELAIMKSTTAEKTVSVLKPIFARHGLPRTVYSDNGPQFKSDVLANYFSETGIHHHRVTPKWPRANGEVERQNQSLLKRMKIAQAEGKDWKDEILTYVAIYRAIPHATTGKSPAELLFGRKIRTKLPALTSDFVDQEVRDQDAEKKGLSKLYADTKRQAVNSDISAGDVVLLKRDQHQGKLDTPFLPEPHHVISKAGSKVTVESPAGVSYDRNTSHVKKYCAPEESALPCITPEIPVSQGRKESPEKHETTPCVRPQRERALPRKFKDFVLK